MSWPLTWEFPEDSGSCGDSRSLGVLSGVRHWRVDHPAALCPLLTAPAHPPLQLVVYTGSLLSQSGIPTVFIYVPLYWRKIVLIFQSRVLHSDKIEIPVSFRNIWSHTWRVIPVTAAGWQMGARPWCDVTVWCHCPLAEQTHDFPFAISPRTSGECFS